ncbi:MULTISPECIES: lipid asymmetry maintenance protein MlaB [unclassified Thioalkalivibrio]|uniref:STAS domain-containing protein n=1 Tax=unclassified Thioalkalivibrio TaxID=2621013 RepID=UPI00037EC626|nr:MULTISPECIES: STAS domain-containing protein [unclassified Thioalkalivibrio]
MADARLHATPEGLALSGTLTFATVPGLESRISALLAGLPARTRVDLGEVTRIDSAGVALLVTLWRRVHEQGGELGFHSIPQGLVPLIELYDLQSVIADSVPAGQTDAA